MTNINKLLNTTAAGLLAQKLDAADGNKNGRIEASIWNEFIKDKGGKEVNEFISVEDAMKSLTTYVVKQAKNINVTVKDLAKEWTEGAPASPAGSADPTDPADPPANSPAKPPADPAKASAKEKAAQEKGLRPTNNKNFYYSETEKEHYKWDSKKKTFIKYPNIAYMAKDGTYRREYKNTDGTRRSVNYSKNGYPTKMEARDPNGRNYIKRDYAAKKLGLRETHATQTKGIYYDNQTKMHYKWNEKTHAFDALDKNTRYVETDGTEYGQNVKVHISTIKDKKTGKLKSRTEDFGNVAYTYDANGNYTKRVYKDANGKVEVSTEYTYDANNNCTKTVSKDANGKVEVSTEYTYDANNNCTKTVYKDANGKVKSSAEYTYDANNNCTKTVYKDANGKEISEDDWYKL